MATFAAETERDSIMGFFSRLFRLDDSREKDTAAPTTDVKLSAKEADAIRNEIDIDAAIAAHERWKARLQDLLDGNSNEQLDPAVVCLDDRCDLGKWLYGPGGQRLGKYPAFQLLIDRHKFFHAQAAEVLTQSQSGNAEAANRTLNSAYKYASSQVILLLKELKRGLGF
jgi:hypothetical protein